jgi:integrase
MFKGTVYRRCTCRVPVTGDDGRPVPGPGGRPKTRELGTDCPELGKRDHGSWYYYVELPPGPGGKRRRPRKGGFPTKTKAEDAAQELWDEAQGGIDVDSKETVEQYLRRWLKKRVDLKRSTRGDYEDYVDRVYIPALGHLALRDLRTRHIQAMFEEIWAYNGVKAANRAAARQAKAECEAARQAWKQAAKPRPTHLRPRWKAAQAALKEANAKPRQDTGPGTQKKYLDTLSAALNDAVKEKLITENWADGVVIPKYRRPDPLVWTDERVARWRKTGQKPGKVMVWTPEQTGAFLDAAVEHPLYVMWHLMVFRAPRRGEATGLPWTEVDMAKGCVNIVEQLVSDSSYGVWEDTPKSRSGRRTITLDSATFALMTAWRDVQKAQRKEWERKHKKDPEKYGPYVDSGYVFTQADGRPWHPENVSQAFERLIKRLGLPPVRLHDLRHCAASLSLAAGLSMKAIQALLGHASYSLTADTYTSLMPQFEKEAADAPVGLVPRKGGDASDNSAPAEEPSEKPESKALYLVKPEASGDASGDRELRSQDVA